MNILTFISESVGANRIAPTIDIPYPVGNPKESKIEEYKLRRNLVERALKSLSVEVDDSTQF